MDGSSINRGQAAFGDIRGWIEALRNAEELEELTGEVDWNVELGNVIRMMQGSGDGPAFLFSDIKDYNDADAICSKIFTGGHASYSRIAMMFGLPQDTPPRELVQICRTIFQERIEPRTVKDGPVKENILTGSDIDLLKFEWGKAVDVNAVEDKIKNSSYDLVSVVHAETSTGVKNDIEKISEIVPPSAIFLVDAVTSLGTMNIEVDKWGIDAIYSCSQKGLSCPPGASPISFSQKAIDKIISSSKKSLICVIPFLNFSHNYKCILIYLCSIRIIFKSISLFYQFRI